MLMGENLRVRRGDRWTLDGVGIRIRTGIVTAVVGPNGAGKSTLLAALTGRLHLETGRVQVDATPFENLTRQDIAQRIAVMQQQTRSTFPFKAFEIVAMGRAPHDGRETAAARARLVEDAMRAAGVLQLADRPCDRISGGERQRVYLARALAQIMPLPPSGPRYLLLDEPTSSLDLRYQAMTLKFARTAAMAGVGVLAILHDLNLAARFADEVLILDRGASAAFGKPVDVFTDRVLRPIYGDGLTIFNAPSGEPVILPDASMAA